VALAFVAEAVDLLVGEQGADGVGELEFASRAGSEVLEHVEDARREDVAADDGVVRGRVLEARFFDHVGHVEQARVRGDGRAVEHAVGGDGRAFDDLGADDAALRLLERLDHLLEARHLRVDDVVGQDNGEGLVVDQFLCHQDGVAEAERLGLARVGDAGQVVDRVDDVEQRLFMFGFEVGFEFGAGVEVVLHGGLAAAGDDDDLGAAGGDGLLDAVLDQRLVDEAEHLLGHGLGGREEARAQAGGGKDGFADFLGGHGVLGCGVTVK